MYKWILPTLSEVLALGESTQFSLLPFGSSSSNLTNSEVALRRFKAEREWRGAIAALEQLLLQTFKSEALFTDQRLALQGLVLAGPVPVLSSRELLSCLQTWIFTGESSRPKRGVPFQLPPAIADSKCSVETIETGSVLPLLSDDPLASEQFCLVLTPHFSLVMVLGEDVDGVPAFLFSFEPELVAQAWQTLRARTLLSHSQSLLEPLEALVEKYYPTAPSYKLVTQFSRLLLKHLPESQGGGEKERGSNSSFASFRPSPRPDVELLQAFAHEVRTPLTTIRTLTRLLLKRRELAAEVIKRLEIIDHECTAQIDRMELLFRAAELEISAVKPKSRHLTAMSLSQVLQQSIPRWHQSASRRDLTLNVVLPQHLPTVVSDPKMLDQVLTGLIENFTRSLPAGSHIQVQVIPAGDQLKLQLLPQSQPGESGKTAEQLVVPQPLRKSLGQLLMFQPETGNISLNLTATKHLFQAIGGKLIVRQRPHQGEVLTIFLPLEISNNVQLS